MTDPLDAASEAVARVLRTTDAGLHPQARTREIAKAALDAAAAGDPEPDVACDIHGVGCTPDSETCAGPWGADDEDTP